MTLRPLITIPIAAYKSRPEYLSAAIQSALSQSWKEVEVVVSDDSPDQSLQTVIEKFRDSRLSYSHNAPKLGVARNHWKCFREARGEFIAVLNHDDCFDPTFLEKLVPPLLGDTNLSLAFSDHWVIDKDGNKLHDETDRLSEYWGRSRLLSGKIQPFFQLFSSQSIPMVMGSVFRRSHLPSQLPENAGPAYDLWLTYLLCREGRGAYFVPERLSSWRAHPGNLTSQGGHEWAIGTAACWHAASRDINLRSIRQTAVQKAAQSYYSCAVSAWRSGCRLNALNYGFQSVRLRPSWKGLIACLFPIIPRSLDNRRER